MVLGNVAILVGSGIIGSVLTSDDGKLPSVGDVFSGAAKFVKNHGKEGKHASSTSDPHAAQLMSQGFLSRASSTREGSSEASNGASSATEARMSTPNASSSLFGLLRLPGLGSLLRSSAS